MIEQLEKHYGMILLSIKCTFITKSYEMFQLRTYIVSINDSINQAMTIIAGDFKYIYTCICIYIYVYIRSVK